MVELKPEEIQTVDYDQMAMQVFMQALELLGGPRRLVEYRNLTWLPSLMEAAYVVVLTEEAHKTEDEIAAFLGVSRNVVRNIRRADPALVQQKLQGELAAQKPLQAHTAGSLAKLAYEAWKRQAEACQTTA